MNCRLAVSFTVPKWAYKILRDISTQHSKVDLDLDDLTRKIVLSADMTDFGTISDDGEWAEINEYLKEVE